MPSFVNPLDHPIRVKDNNGVLQRITPGQVVDATGEYADRLQASKATSADSDAVSRWEQRQASAAGPAGTGPGSRIAAKQAIGPRLMAHRLETVVAPLQRVVGDDAAPHGPASGTITTRGEAGMSGDPRDAEAFLQHDVAPVESAKIDGASASELDVLAGRATQPDIHNAQVDNAIAAEDAAKRLVGARDAGIPHNGVRLDPGTDYSDARAHTKTSLEQEIEQRRGEGREINVTGTGKDGNVVRADLEKALADDDKARDEKAKS